MRLSKERKVYLAVFGIGLTALAVDRLFLAPSDAAAAPTDPATEPPAVASSPRPASEPVALPPTAPSFADRLAKMATWQEGPLQDAFVAPESWRATPAADVEPDGPQKDAFVAKHRVTWAGHSAKGAVALVDGKMLGIGQVVDGFRFVSILESADGPGAVFEKGGCRVELFATVKMGRRTPDKADAVPAIAAPGQGAGAKGSETTGNEGH